MHFRMNSYKLAFIFLILDFGVSVFAISKNQEYWLKLSGHKRWNGCGDMCCSGRNSSCYSYGSSMNSKAKGRCFCDEGCLDMGDCCVDYSASCKAVDCVVGEWEDYSDCSKACGLGSKKRSRPVLQQPKNGGQACPVLKESTVCIGKRCKSQRHLGARGRSDRETAKIMPASYGQFRQHTKYNAHMDIRKNLYYKYYAHRYADRRGYCATYEITSTRRSCFSKADSWANVLRKGTKICVECQSKAMDGSPGNSCVGHGNQLKDTFWTTVNVHGCHGWWRRTNELSECSCNTNKRMDFIFV